MANSSSNSLWKYDVFLSFCGRDTRKGFVSHLYREMDRLGIKAFKDDERLERGASIGQELMQAIKESKFAVPIISKNYASSGWCLRELAEIVECGRKGSLTVILPVFYDVDPSDVRKQKGSLGKVFREHQREVRKRRGILGEIFTQQKGENMEDLKTWKEALNRVGNIAGEESRKWKDEAELIQKISKYILDRLNASLPNGDNNLVGIGAHVERIEPLLSLESNDDISIIGVCGMGGIGKSTIARSIYKRFSCKFSASCFIENVKGFHKVFGEERLQEYFLSKIFQEKDLKLPSGVDGCNVIKERLKNLKVLVVLDDIDKRDQLEILLGKAQGFAPGSRIIVTSRDTGLISAFQVCTVKIYEVKCMTDADAIQLFCQSAFGNNYPPEGFLELAINAAKYACGLPLALKVWGSFVCGMSKDEMRTAQFELDKNLHGDIMGVLRASYDALDERAKHIFLYIACLFRGEHVDRVVGVLNSRISNVEFWIRVLVKKCLVNVSSSGNIGMHDLLAKLGRELNRRQSIDQPGRRRILLDATEIQDVINNTTGTEVVEVISLNMSEVYELVLTDEAFRRLSNLRVLNLYGGSGNTNVEVSKLKHLPPKLVFMQWSWCPLDIWPSEFRPECLVELLMPHNKLKRLWEGTMVFSNVKKMDLHGSENLEEIPDLSMASSLEELDLSECASLTNVSSIQSLQKLGRLALRGCEKLEQLPSLSNMKSLKFLYLDLCASLNRFPEVSSSVERLHISGTAIEEVPPSIGHLICLKYLSAPNCKKMRTISRDIGNLIKLEILDLAGCEVLEDMPETIQDLNSLLTLIVSNCKKLQSLPKLPHSLQFLNAHDCSSLANIHQRLILPPCHLILSGSKAQLPEPKLPDIGSAHLKEMGKPYVACLPGSEVPGYYTSRALGSSLTADVPESCRSVGFLASIVVATESVLYPPIVFVLCKCHLRRRNGTESVFNPSWPKPYHGGKTELLFSFSYRFEKAEEVTQIGFEFSLESIGDISFLKIKECGVRPIFIEDLDRAEAENFIALDVTQPEQNRNRVADDLCKTSQGDAVYTKPHTEEQQSPILDKAPKGRCLEVRYKRCMPFYQSCSFMGKGKAVMPIEASSIRDVVKKLESVTVKKRRRREVDDTGESRDIGDREENYPKRSMLISRLSRLGKLPSCFSRFHVQ